MTLSGITVSASADETPPAPAAAQAGLEAGSTSYSIEFTEPVALVSTEADLAAGLKFTIGGSEEPVSAARVDADDPSIVHVTLASAAALTDTASFTIAADLLKDAVGNENEATQQAIELTIADTTGPALAGEQEKLEARETEYRITFTEPVILVDTEAALAAGITISIDGTDVEVTAASIDAADGKYVDITLASGASLGSNVNLSVSENLLKDAANIQNAATPTIGITVADTSGPKLLPQQEDIAELDKSYILRFDENLKLKAGADLTAGILINVGGRLTDIGAKNPYVGWSDPTAVRIYLPNVIEGESVTIRIAADLFTDANGNANGGQNFTKIIQVQAGVGRILASHFDGIKAMTVDKTNDDIYIAAGYTSSHTIQKIDKYGDKTTIIDSGLSEPAGLALYDNNLYVSDWGKILKFNLSDPANIPAATVVAGDGNGTGVSFPGPLAINGDGDTLYVIDDRAYIREINLETGEVKTIAGGGTASQGKGSDTEFSSYGNLAIDKDDKYLYVADTSHHQIKKIDLESADKTVTIVAGSGMKGNVNAYGTNAEFDEPYGICLDKTGDYLFVSSGSGNGLIRRITLSNSKVEYFAGELYTDYEFGVGEGSLSEILFGRPYHFAAGSGNFFYVGDDMRGDVRKLYLP